MMSGTRFLVLIQSGAAERQAGVAIGSLRAFGGSLANTPVWAFVCGPTAPRASQVLAGSDMVERHGLEVEDSYLNYPFGAKVAVCAQAEALAGTEAGTLIWLSLDSLIIKPPVLFQLGAALRAAPADVAFRPVHHRNVGSLATEPLDDYWQTVYRRLDVDEMPYTVDSFVDQQTLRPYFNTHSFAFNPATGLAEAWWAHFKAMVDDETFQAGPAGDPLHKIFLHQAIFSTLVPKMLSWERIRQLPPTYNYPLNLLGEMLPKQKPDALNDLVTAVYEDAFPWGEIEVREPLRSWLRERLPRVGSLRG